MSKLILASSSPSRLQLVKQIGYLPDLVVAPDVDETELPEESPAKLVERLAILKATVVAQQFPEDVVLAADTIAFCRKQILIKAADEEMAKQYLNILSGRRHRSYTGVCVRKGDRVMHAVHCTIVHFKKLSPAEINEFVASGLWRGNAGGYAIRGVAAAFVKSINGLESCVAGLPLIIASNMLRAAGLIPAFSEVSK
jgi:septum formation protein